MTKNSKEDRNQFGEQSLCPEQHLWRAVIERAIWDAVYCRMRTLKKATKQTVIRIEPSTLINATKARQWFEGNSKHFRFVCELADYEPSRIREFALAMIERCDNLLIINQHRAPSYYKHLADRRALTRQSIIQQLGVVA